MGHVVGPCDFLDVLEEAVVLGSAVVVELRNGAHFTDTVRQVATDDGEDLATFRDHGRMPLHDISDARRAYPRMDGYQGKLGQ
jgi:energy-converting hydrogenase Eha subunit F